MTSTLLQQAVEALTTAVRQNEHDMLMTGEELRAARAALAALESALQQQPEPVAPFWYAVVSDEAPAIDKAIRRADVAEEYAQNCRENGYTRVQVVPLYTPPALQQQEEPREPTDAQALAFHRAITDGSIGSDDIEDIKTGLRAAFAASPTPQDFTLPMVEEGKGTAGVKACLHRPGESCPNEAACASPDGCLRMWPRDALPKGPLKFPQDKPGMYATPGVTEVGPADPWRPIDTAPKDGREVILREGGRVGAACWIKWPDTYDSDGAPDADSGEGWTVGFDGDEWREPDAWQPLPPVDYVKGNDDGC